MITNGISNSSTLPFEISIKTEFGDVLNGESCSDAPDFPEHIFDAAFVNFHGTPVVCGGCGHGYFTTYYQECYKFTNFGWQEFASMKDKRGHAAGVMYKDKFHIFGGADGSIPFQTSEMISIDGQVEYGPDLPQWVFSHTIAAINATFSILSGGVTHASQYSPLTWYFNHETAVFSSGPNLLEGRITHGSATNVDTVTKAKIVVVTGGFNVTFMKSTEVLINGQWQPGTI